MIVLGFVFARANQAHKLEATLLDNAEKAVAELFVDTNDQELSYMNDDTGTTIAKEQVLLIVDQESQDTLMGRVRVAEGMYRDQERCIDVINLLLREGAYKDDLAQSDIDRGTALLEKVTNQKMRGELAKKLKDITVELDAQKNTVSAIGAVEEAQKTAWDEDLAIAAEAAIELVKNEKARAGFVEQMAALRAAELEKAQNTNGANQESPSRSGTGLAASGAESSSGIDFRFGKRPEDFGHVPVWWPMCTCGNVFRSYDELLIHIESSSIWVYPGPDEERVATDPSHGVSGISFDGTRTGEAYCGCAWCQGR